MTKFYAVRRASDEPLSCGNHHWVWLTEETEEFQYAAGIYIIGQSEGFKLLQLVERDAIAVDAKCTVLTHDEIMARYNAP